MCQAISGRDTVRMKGQLIKKQGQPVRKRGQLVRRQGQRDNTQGQSLFWQHRQNPDRIDRILKRGRPIRTKSSVLKSWVRSQPNHSNTKTQNLQSSLTNDHWLLTNDQWLLTNDHWPTRSVTATYPKIECFTSSSAPDHTHSYPTDGNAQSVWLPAKSPSAHPIPGWPQSCIANKKVYGGSANPDAERSHPDKSVSAV